VQDTEPPTITCPANITTSNDPGQCGAVVLYNFLTSDNCPGVTLEAVPPSGSFFPVGTTTVTGVATDAAGNSTQCNFSVRVRGGLKLTSPNGGETINAGGRKRVRWKSTGNPGEVVRLDLFRHGNFVRAIKRATVNDGKFRWRVPDNLPAGDGYTVRITSTSLPDFFDDSNDDFTIAAAR
jgi:hypothetical protein